MHKTFEDYKEDLKDRGLYTKDYLMDRLFRTYLSHPNNPTEYILVKRKNYEFFKKQSLCAQHNLKNIDDIDFIYAWNRGEGKKFWEEKMAKNPQIDDRYYQKIKYLCKDKFKVSSLEEVIDKLEL